MSVAFSPDGQRLASASWDQTVKVWDAVIGQETPTLTGHTEQVWSVAFSPDGKRIASAGADRDVKVWDPETRTGDPHLQGAYRRCHQRGVQPRRHADRLRQRGPDRETVGRRDRAGRSSLSRDTPSVVDRVAFSPDGRRSPPPAGIRRSRLWDAATGRETLTFKGHDAARSTSVAFSPDGQPLASASGDRTVKVWDAATGQETLTLKGHTGQCLERGVQPRRPAARLRRRGRDGEGLGRRDRAGNLHSQGPCRRRPGVAFSPDGQRLASASYGGTVHLWDLRTGQETLSLEGHIDVVTSVAFSPDGHRLASASRDRTVKLWDARPVNAAVKAGAGPR